MRSKPDSAPSLVSRLSSYQTRDGSLKIVDEMPLADGGKQLMRARHSGSHYREFVRCPGCGEEVPRSEVDDTRRCDKCDETEGEE